MCACVHADCGGTSRAQLKIGRREKKQIANYDRRREVTSQWNFGLGIRFDGKCIVGIISPWKLCALMHANFVHDPVVGGS